MTPPPKAAPTSASGKSFSPFQNRLFFSAFCKKSFYITSSDNFGSVGITMKWPKVIGKATVINRDVLLA